MIFVAKNADFSANKIGTVEIPEDITVGTFTRSAIAASGGSFTEGQEVALEKFFRSIGAVDNTALWQKIKILLLPMIVSDINKAFMNYVGNNVLDFTGVSNFDTAYECVKGKGIRSTLPVGEASQDNDCPDILLMKQYINEQSGYTLMDYPSQKTRIFNMLFLAIDYFAWNAGGISYKGSPQYNHKEENVKGKMLGLTAKDASNVIISFYGRDGRYMTEEQTRSSQIDSWSSPFSFLFGTNGVAKTQAENGMTERTAHGVIVFGEPFTGDEMIQVSNACDAFKNKFIIE